MKLVIGILTVIAIPAYANITLQLSDEVKVSDGTLCIYSNSQRSEEFHIAKGRECPNVRTFED
ncbi:hypothetical protein ROSI111154_23850 [Rouxiella silvae]